MRVKWTNPGGKSLESILDYIARDEPGTASKFIQKVRHATDQLSDHPKLGREGRVLETYELVIFGLPYIVAYRVKGKEVHILNVYHASRKWP